MRPRSNPSRPHAFTLIELLVVIAIIAILAAIIFPVFATVRENARQSSSISNMRQISTALGQFQLDNHRNPDVLFGYVYYLYSDSNGDPAYPGTGKTPLSMDTAFSQAQTDAHVHPDANVIGNSFPGLYPEYVRDVATFRDANNQENGNVPSKIANIDATVNGTPLNGNTPVNVLCPSADRACMNKLDGTLTATTRKFYAEDAYDVSPQVLTGTNQVSKDIYVTRYQSAWTSIDATLNSSCSDTTMPTPSTCNGNTTSSTNFYTHQMHWKNPPAETYVTSTTQHVRNANTVLVLFEGGNAKKMSVDQFQQFGPDAATVAVPMNGNVSPANFWKLSPAGR